MKKGETGDEKVLNFKVIRDDLDTALVTLQNRIDRAWPEQLKTIAGARALFLLMIKVAVNTYESIRFLAADIPKENAPRLEDVLSIPPLARSLLDQLFTVIFLSEDLPTRTQRFYKGGWREIKEEYDRYQTKYGDRPEWTSWLQDQEDFIKKTQTDWGISTEEAAILKKIKYWPTPYQILKQSDLWAETRTFLEYLDAWFYRELSSEAHLSFPGLAHRGEPLLLKPGSTERIENLTKKKSQAVATTITLVLAMASEMEHLLKIDLRDKLAYIWGVLINYWQEAEDLYKMRYARLLTGSDP